LSFKECRNYQCESSPHFVAQHAHARGWGSRN
jgi:hypothetical protein